MTGSTRTRPARSIRSATRIGLAAAVHDGTFTPVLAVLLAAPAAAVFAALLALSGPATAAAATESVAAESVATESAVAASPADDAPTAAGAAGTWHWPVAPPIVVAAPFRAPATPYAAGHRGIDLATSPGEVVTAPADGVVSFAGMVAGRPVLAIDHGDGVVSSLEPVAAEVGAGDRVVRGQRVGTVAAGGHCGEACVHLGARVDGDYVSPHRFLGGLPRAVLLPWRS